MNKMIGKTCQPFCGRDCCGNAPGRDRKVHRRAAKRGERSRWRAKVWQDMP